MIPSRTRLALLTLLVGCLALPRISPAGDDLPSWAREAMRAPTPAEASGSDAVALLRYGSIEITGKDAFVERERGAIRILRSGGSERAIAVAEYRTDGGKVRSLKAWIVSPSGVARQIPGKEAVDVSRAGEDMVSESRARSLSGESDAVPGATFAWESEVERRSAFGQFQWYFQDDLPTVRSDFAFRPLPEWSVRSTVLNGDSLPPAIADGWWTWNRSGLPPIRNEAYSPPFASLASRLAINATPPPGSPEGAMRSFARWEEVAGWLHQASAANGAATPAIAAKAEAVTAGATTTARKIRAIAAYCQSLNYVSIQMGLSRGGGYIPHAAEDVMRKGYGDCKDKANLMRAMLGAVGIESYLCGISAFDPGYARESWPTPGQFDHCIIAVRSDDSAACAVAPSTLGRLVLFDPTDPTMRWGDLPDREQGGLALLFTTEQGALVRVPLASPERGRHRRRFDARIDSDGSIAGTVEIVASGSSASHWRAWARSRGAAGLASSPDLWLSSAVSTATVDSFAQSDPPDDDAYRIRAAFRIPRFGRPMAGNLLILDTGKLTTMEIALPPEKPRTAPMSIPRFSASDEIHLTLPAGYGVDGVPAPVTIESPYGRYTATLRVEGDEVSIVRTSELPRSYVPVSRSVEARDFFLRVKRALDTPLVLSKK